MYNVTYDARMESWSAQMTDGSSCQIHFHSCMLSPLQAPEGPTFNNQRFQDARNSPGGADQKNREFY
jgi:hypothetical protein